MFGCFWNQLQVEVLVIFRPLITRGQVFVESSDKGLCFFFIVSIEGCVLNALMKLRNGEWRE